MVIAGLLCAVGIVIPLFSPIKVVMEPASFTLASHVAVFIAMFISPVVALAVAVGTTIGFFFGGFPLVVVLRALTHVIFAWVGAMILKKDPDILMHFGKSQIFSLGIGILHALCEVAVVMPFFFGNAMSAGYYDKGFWISVILLVGVGSVIHSMVDFAISLFIWKPLKKVFYANTQSSVRI